MTAWLTPDDFVADFGEPEVIAMTAGPGTDEIDRPLIERAIARAQSMAESYLAGRYALPLTQVPPVLAGAVADLARARLYPRGAPEGVLVAAKAATATLEAIAAGRMTLGLDAAAVPVAPPSDAPVLVAPGRRQYPDGLADY